VLNDYDEPDLDDGPLGAGVSVDSTEEHWDVVLLHSPKRKCAWLFACCCRHRKKKLSLSAEDEELDEEQGMVIVASMSSSD